MRPTVSLLCHVVAIIALYADRKADSRKLLPQSVAFRTASPLPKLAQLKVTRSVSPKDATADDLATSPMTPKRFEATPPAGPKKSATQPKLALLEATRDLNYGVRASKSDAERIESLLADLLATAGAKNLAVKAAPALAFAATNSASNKRARELLGGDWQLLYTSGPDVTSIGKIPGVSLDYVGQTVDTDSNVITNLVYASGFLADTEQQVFVAARSVGSSRVELDFSGTKIQLKKILGRDSFFGRRVANIKPLEVVFDREKFDAQIKKSGRPTPGFEIVYLDEDLRVQRTGEGYIFVIQKRGGRGGGTPSLASDGLGPWLTDKIGPNGMLALGLVSLLPYLGFLLLGYQRAAGY